MRVTQTSMFLTARGQIQRSALGLLDAQEKAASQKRINRMSDDPIGGRQVLSLRTALAQSAQFQRNIANASSLSDLYDTTLGQVVEALSRAKELLLGQANDISTSDQTREAARVEIVSLRGSVLQAANARLAGRYIFSGFNDTQPAFLDAFTTTTPGGGNTGGAAVTAESLADPAQFTGDTYRIQFTAPGAFDIFNVTRGIFESTGNAYTSGQAIRFAGVSIALTDSPGAPATGDVFDVTPTAAGTYQGDSGEVKLELEEDKRVTVNLTGDAVFQGVGLPNGNNLFDLYNRAVTALRDNDPVEIEALLDDFDAALGQIANAQGSIGARQSLFDGIQSRLSSLDTMFETVKSNTEDMDLADAITKLNQQETAYQTTLMAASRVTVPSLLDFLR